MTRPAQPATLTTSEVAEFLGITATSVRIAARRGWLPSQLGCDQYGNPVRIYDPEDVREYRDRQQARRARAFRKEVAV